MEKNFDFFEVKTFLLDSPQSDAAKAMFDAHKQKDLMFLRFELCHANVNRNKDGFLKEDLKESYKTAIAKPINWKHTNEVIGHIFNAEYVEFDGASGDVDTKTDTVVCDGVVYKYKFPAKAREIKSRYDNDKLFFSMETYFDKAQCSVCGEKFDPDGDYCEHLKGRFSKYKEAARYLKGPHFAGVGCVENPADDARGLVVASRDHNIVPLMELLGDRFTIAQYIDFLELIKAVE